MLYWTTGIIVMWLLCALFVTGVTVAYFQNEFRFGSKFYYMEDLFLGITLGIIFAPISAICVVFLSDFLKYGWSLKPLKDS